MSHMEKYKSDLHKYEAFSNEIKRIIVESFDVDTISYHNIAARAKSPGSFNKKAAKLNLDGSPKYPNPLSDITDLAAVRIICYTLKDVQAACACIDNLFSVKEKADVGEQRADHGKFGYQSIHYLVNFSADRENLKENKKYARMVCEIQIRTVLQHAWAEMEHDIQYKSISNLPKSIERKFLSLAGLLEIADREFQNIQDEDAVLKKLVKEELRDDLTRAAISGDSNGVSSPAEQVFTQGSQGVAVRDLVRAGNYREAVALYDEKIHNSPSNNTLYIGRARAKFLMGDSESALEDARKARHLHPGDPSAERLITLILEGGRPNENTGLFLPAVENPDPSPLGNNEANRLTREGNRLLENGDGVEAYEFYSQAQLAGASRPFSIFNKAMACLIAGDIDGSRDHLFELNPREGTPMSISASALSCIIAAITHSEDYDSKVNSLVSMLDNFDDYSYQMSPLKKIEEAVVSKFPAASDKVGIIYESLKG